ncbi:AraC family transcriptional regulator [Parabacteroides distasonis]|nr:AraC family transcriptional regulator [Parabacteroides distasonis]
MMQEIFLNTVQDFNDYQGVETLHPLVSVVRVENTEHIKECVMHYGLYAIYLKENKGCKLSYGRTPYDFDEMTVTSFSPGQTVTVEPNPDVPFVKFTALVFHPDLLNRTPLAKQMNRYEFFDYTSTEALHLSAQEVEIFKGVLTLIEQELHRAIDKHTRELIVSNIELLLNYCLRFYDRQFITREEINHTVVKKFLNQLDEYINEKAVSEGLPTVAYFAGKCCLSTGYFGTLVKTETGRTAKDLINDRILAKAKALLQSETSSVTQVSVRLGFEYPQHFIRFFKSLTGKTPSQWRAA